MRETERILRKQLAECKARLRKMRAENTVWQDHATSMITQLREELAESRKSHACMAKSVKRALGLQYWPRCPGKTFAQVVGHAVELKLREANKAKGPFREPTVSRTRVPSTNDDERRRAAEEAGWPL